VAVQVQEYEEMPKLRSNGHIGALSSLAVLLALAAAPTTRAEDAGTPVAPTPAAPAVALPESTVLPNAPKVGDAAPSTEAGAASGADAAATEGSPDWPCVQRKVMTITPAQVWDGPPLDSVKGWENDQKIAELTSYLESRRIPLEKAEAAVKEYAQSVPATERDKKLTELFASVLKKINSDRQFVIGRVEEFQRRQKGRADELEREGRKLTDLNQEIPADEQAGPRDAKLTPAQTEYNWNARIFQDRQQNLTVACDIPILIEQRVYEIGRLIRAQMSS
jgi:hypothetical protein